MKRIFLAGVAVLSLSPLLSRGADQLPAGAYTGATALLKQIDEQAQKPATEEKPSEQKKLRLDLESFSTNAAALKGPESAKQWLELVDRFLNLQNGVYRPGEEVVQVQSTDVLRAVPPPVAWDELAKLVQKRTGKQGPKAAAEVGLRLLVHTLRGDQAAQTNDMAAIGALAKPGRNGYLWQNISRELGEAVLEMSDDPSAILASLEQELRMAANNRNRQQVRIPDLVSILGEEDAARFIRRALRASNVELTAEEGDDTQKLARRLALELIDELKIPQWHLAASLDGVDLLEAWAKRFGRKPQNNDEGAAPDAPPPAPGFLPMPMGDGDYARQRAETYYLLGLITRNRDKDAADLAVHLAEAQNVYLPHEAFMTLDRAGYTRALNRFFRELLTKKPDLPFWENYFDVAAKAGDSDTMLNVARAAVAREDIGPGKRAAIGEQLYRALLAADRVEEGIDELRKLLAAPSSTARQRYSRGSSHSQLAVQLIRLGQLLERKELIDEGLKQWQRPPGDSPEAMEANDDSRLLALTLVDLGRGVEAERILGEALARAIKMGADREDRFDGYGFGRSEPPLLEALGFVYFKGGRTNDVLALLDGARYWGAKDLVDLMSSHVLERSFVYGGLAHEAIGSVAHITASALIANNRKDEAHRIVDALLDQNGGDDSAYELLLQLSGQNSIARLDDLFSRDPFEERPLIWKAVLLQKEGQLEEAEKLARQAISIDPSDGEQGPGRRMRAYAVLADIRAARGDIKEAEFLRGAVKAIRLSEQADRFYEAGLITRAVKMYEEALTHFSDAYCIQSRLALRMSQLGLHDAAEAHYQKAYELMPDSFGRVESHCFGCEGVFNGKHPQEVAERVFQSLTNKSPYKPQVQYLFGYLRQQQGRYGESLKHFQNAVRLDPDYLNAWVKIQDAARHVRLSSADRDEAAFNVIRLDPLGRHAQPNLARVKDLRGLWAALQEAAEKHPSPPSSLYPLKASAAALEMAQKKNRVDMRFRSRTYFYSDGLTDSSTTRPADALAQNAFIRVAGQLLDQSGQGMMEE